jgi:hypothetical protein
MTSTLTIEDVARVCHEANRALQLATGDPTPSPAWDDAPDWQRVSALNGIQAALSGATPEQLHEEWCQEKAAGGWVYGETKDAEARTHPCMVAYADLPVGQQAKDAVFGAIVGALLGGSHDEAKAPTVRTYRIQYNASIGNRTEMLVEADSYGRTNPDCPSVEFYRNGRTVAEIMAGSLVVVEEIPRPSPLADTSGSKPGPVQPTCPPECGEGHAYDDGCSLADPHGASPERPLLPGA